MRCYNCNADIPDDSRFCPECGAMQTNAAAQPQAAAEDILAGIQLEDEPVSAPAAPAQPAAPQYQAPASNYQAPQSSYQAPQNSYQAPQNSYQAPQSSYQAPQNSYQAPQSSYQAPQSSYQAPQSSYQAPQNSYQAPQNSYTPPASNYQVPADNNYQVPSDSFQPAQPLKAEKKKSKKGLIIGLAAGGVVIAALVAVLLLFSGKPLQKALKGTQSDLNAMLSTGNLGTVTKNLDKLKDQATTTVNAGIDGIEGMEASLNLELNQDAKNTLTDGSLNFSMNMFGETSGGTVRFAADKEAAQFAIDGVDGTYGLRYGNILKLMGEENAQTLELDGEQATLSALQKGPMKPIFDSIKDEEVGQTRIATDGGDKVCKHFVVTWDEKAVEQVAKDLNLDAEDGMEGMSGLLKDGKLSMVNVSSAGMVTALRELKPSIDIYTCNNRIIGIDVHTKDESTVFVRLLGDKNVFEHVRITTSDDEEAVNLTWEKGGLLRLSLSVDGEDMEILRYDDKTGNFSVAEELLDDPSVSGTLKPTSKGAELTINLGGEALEGGSVRMVMEISPLKNSPKQLADRFTDLTEASEEELDTLVSGAMEKLGLAGLTGLLGGGYDDGDDWGWDDGGDDWTWDNGDTDDGLDWGWDDGDDGEDDNWTSENGDLEGYTGALTMDDVWGSYDFAYIEAYGMQFTAEDLDMSADDNYFTLRSDGTGIFVWEGDSSKLNWTLEGNVIHLTDRDSDEEVFDIVYTQDGNLAIEAEDGLLVFVRDVD